MSSIVADYNLFGAPAVAFWKGVVMDTSGTVYAWADRVDFAVKIVYSPWAGDDEEETVYSGRAARRPGDAYVSVRLNEIISGFLRGEPQILGFPFDVPGHYAGSQATTASGLIRLGSKKDATVLLVRIVWSDPAGVLEDVTEEVTVINNRDVFSSLSSNGILNAPINRRLASGQCVCLTMTRCRALELYRMEPVPGSPGSYYSVKVWEAVPEDPAISQQIQQLTDQLPSLYDQLDALYFEYNRAVAQGDTERAEELMEQIQGLEQDIDGILGQIEALEAQLAELDPLGSGPAYAVIRYANLSSGNYRFRVIYTDENDESTFVFSDMYKVSACSTYSSFVVHYLNELGGWDSLVAAGRFVDTKNIKRETYDRGVPYVKGNGLAWSADRQKAVIMSDTVQHLELHTPWLSPYEAQRIGQLLGSVDVWVERLNDSRFGLYPAVLTGNSYQEKAYRGWVREDNWYTFTDLQTDPGKLIQYTIDLDIAFTERRQ